MALKVGVIVSRKFRAREKICPSLANGIAAAGDKPISLRAERYNGVFSDAVIFYGFDGNRDSNIARAFDDYRKAGLKAVYVDLGYFKKRDSLGRYGDYHRFSVNDRHPTAYFQNIKHPSDRFDQHHRKIAREMRQGKNIILCGMSDKASRFDGCGGLEQWERDAIDKIKAVTDRPIVYRPKPQVKDKPQYPAIAGVGYSDPRTRSLEDELKDSWAVVSHHSNAGIDALLAGVPCFQAEGVAVALGLSDLSMIEQPRLPNLDERRQFMFDVAYCQFNRAEMENGTAWRHLKSEGLVP